MTDLQVILQVNLENRDTVKTGVMEKGVYLVPQVSRAFLDLPVQPDHPVTAIPRPVILAQAPSTSLWKTLAWRDRAETKNLSVGASGHSERLLYSSVETTKHYRPRR